MSGGNSGNSPPPAVKPASATPPSQVKPPVMQVLRKSEDGQGTLRKA